MWRLGFVVLGACAATTSVCPTGTRLVVGKQGAARAEWCSTTETALVELPVPGRSYAGALDVQRPTGLPGHVDGPFTSWYADGSVQSHGGYVDSLPDGTWSFWYPDGKPQSVGVYHRGEPVGCFAAWDASGALSTGRAQGTELHVEPCTPPPPPSLAAIERRDPPSIAAPRGDVTVLGFVGAGPIGARNGMQVDPDPRLGAAFDVTARRRLGRFRVGPTAGFRASSNTDYRGMSAGLALAVALPSPHPRLDLEAAADLDVEYLSATAMLRGQTSTGSVSFWAPLAGLQLAAALALSPTVEVIAAVRLDGAPISNRDTEVVYCDLLCYPAHRETWQVGGGAVGGMFGIRLRIP